MALIVMASASLFVLPYDTLIPVFAKVVFKGGASTFGYISSFMGLGAISGTLFLASAKEKSHTRQLLINTLILGIGLLLFSHTNYFPVAMIFAVITGFGAMSQTTLCLTIIQLEADANMRGRVMSYVAMAYFGMLPLGSLLIGSVSHWLGAPNALMIQGILALIIALLFYLVQKRKNKIQN